MADVGAGSVPARTADRMTRGGLEGVNLLEIAPLRRAQWEEVAGRVVILRPPPSARGPRRLIEWLSFVMSAKRIRLDEAGSLAWRLFDGKTSVAEAARAMRETLGEAVDPVEERLGHLVRQLRGEGLLAYPGWDDLAGEPPRPR